MYFSSAILHACVYALVRRRITIYGCVYAYVYAYVYVYCIRVHACVNICVRMFMCTLRV